MSKKVVATKLPGVRYREHDERRHGVAPDRYFFIRYKINGVLKEEGVGWASQGMSAKKAYALRAEICENLKSGTGPRSLAEKRAEHEVKAKEIEREGRAKAKSQTSFSEYWDSIYFPAIEATKTERTIGTEKGYYIKWIQPIIGDTPLQKLNAPMLEGLILTLQKSGKSAGTVAKIMGIVSQVWHSAALRDIVSGDFPGRRVKKPKQDSQRERFLTQEEARNLLAALRVRSIDIHDEALLSLFCGLRAGEIHKLTFADLDIENASIRIRDPKSKKNRYAFMTAEVKEALNKEAICG